jgi:hypothetical protein
MTDDSFVNNGIFCSLLHYIMQLENFICMTSFRPFAVTAQLLCSIGTDTRDLSL